jgi:hypothetical protein
VNGDDLWRWEWSGVLVRVRKTGPTDPTNLSELEYLVKVPAEKLQAALDRAEKQFFDPSRPASPPTPDFLAVSPSPSWVSPPRKRTRGSS